METLDRYFDHINLLADRLEENANFDADLITFREAAAALRDHLYRHTDDDRILDHLDQLAGIDLSPPEAPLMQRLLPRGAREMYGKYQHKEKIREQVRQVVGRFMLIRRLLG